MSFPTLVQKQVIDHTGKPLIVIAAPGTGKTSTVVARMIRLLKENPNREVAFITFTRSSRKDTENKVKREVGKKAFEDATFEFPRVSTLHTYAKSIVHRYAQNIDRDNNFSILICEKNEDYLLMAELAEDLQLDIDISRLIKDIEHYLCKQHFPPDSPIPIDRREELLERYDKLLKFYNTFDFASIVKSACEILSEDSIEFPQVFLQVDEYQDLNPMDQKLVELASSTSNSQVVVVGDDAQSIYGFRHANPSGIKKLWGSEEWDKICFKDCHRLPAHILCGAQALISGEDYLGGEVNLPPNNDLKINTLQCTTSDVQIDAVAHLIKKIKSIKKNSKGDPLCYKDFMILCPISNFVNKISQTLEATYQIPTKQKTKSIIPDDHWRLLLVLRLLCYRDSLALHQWLAVIGMEPKDITNLRLMAMKAGETLYDYCSKLTQPEIKEIFEHLANIQKNIDEIEEFKKSLLRFPKLSIKDTLSPEINITINDATQKPYSLASIIGFIYEKYGLIDSEDEISEDISEEDKVLVTTMHSAKGLEAEFVFIMWLNEGFMPMPDRDIPEQLRVLYVGITRAKQDVIFTFHEKYIAPHRIKIQAMSPFLKKIVTFLNIIRVKKSDCATLSLGA